MPTFLEAIERFSPKWLLGQYAEGFVGATLELVGDAAGEAFSSALVHSWLLDPNSPDDALPIIGREQRMPKYPLETNQAYRLRLWDAWTAYHFGGSKTAIELQLEQAGFPGQVLYSGPYAADNYYSQFWVYFPKGTHQITAAGPEWGSFDWGDGTRWGPIGMPYAHLKSLIDLINKWKNSQWICQAMVFEIDGFLLGTGKKWGQHKWGGESVPLRV